MLDITTTDDREAEACEDPEEAFEKTIQTLRARTKSMTGKVEKLSRNLYRVQGSGDLNRFDLQGSQSWAGQGNKQSATAASGYVTLGEASLLESRAASQSSVTVTWEELPNQIDLKNIHVT